MFGKHGHTSSRDTQDRMSGKLVRAIAPSGPPVRFVIDGREATAFAGDSVLVAVLSAHTKLRQHEFSGEPRAGFCLMGACQDCWVWLADGQRIRACTTAVTEGMHVVTAGVPGFSPS
jgi:predicted molibdopterin-dependent oxidoreductase YjgC